MPDLSVALPASRRTLVLPGSQQVLVHVARCCPLAPKVCLANGLQPCGFPWSFSIVPRLDDKPRSAQAVGCRPPLMCMFFWPVHSHVESPSSLRGPRGGAGLEERSCPCVARKWLARGRGCVGTRSQAQALAVPRGGQRTQHGAGADRAEHPRGRGGFVLDFYLGLVCPTARPLFLLPRCAKDQTPYP